jgi:hypothetical protein
VTETGGVLVSMPHGCLERLRKVQGKEKTGQGYVVDLVCKDLRTIRFGLPGKLQYKQLVSVLEALAYELEISQLFAMKWKAAEYAPWRFDAVAECVGGVRERSEELTPCLAGTCAAAWTAGTTA